MTNDDDRLAELEEQHRQKRIEYRKHESGMKADGIRVKSELGQDLLEKAQRELQAIEREIEDIRRRRHA